MERGAEGGVRQFLIPAAVSAAAAAPAAAAVLTRTGLVDREGAAAHFAAIHGADGRFRLAVFADLHKAEAFGSAGVIRRQRGAGRSPLGEGLDQLLLGDGVGE